MTLPKRHMIVALVFGLCLTGVAARATLNEYVRDYGYHATRYDSEYTARINAIAGVKQTLLDELGTFIKTVINIRQDSGGESFFAQDTVAMTAGVISTKVLVEKWQQPVYYVKASMQADPEEIKKAAQALGQNHELEAALRDSMRKLDSAQKELQTMREQMKSGSLAPAREAQLARAYTDSVKSVEAEHIFQKALQARLGGNFDEAFRLLKGLADAGNGKAMIRIGFMYERGMSVTRDYGQARHWYQKAMAASEANGIARMGWLYERGLGVNKDPFKAAEHYRRAISRDSDIAYAMLGWLYRTDQIGQIDVKKAVDYFHQGASRGDPRAEARLGFHYMRGYGVEQDYARARQYLEKAARTKEPMGMSYLALMYAKGWGMDENPSLAVELAREATRYQQPIGMGVLGLLYEEGIGVKQDYDQAIKLHEKAIEMGSPFSEFRLGRMYLRGEGVAQDRDEGLKWIKRAADKGHPMAKEVYERVSSRW